MPTSSFQMFDGNTYRETDRQRGHMAKFQQYRKRYVFAVGGSEVSMPHR